MPFLAPALRDQSATTTPVVWAVLVEDYTRPLEARADSCPWREGLTPADLLPEGWERELTQVLIDGQPASAGCWSAPLEPLDTVRLVRTPGVFEGTGFWAVVGNWLIYSAVSFAIARLVAGPSKESRDSLDERSPYYGWSGPFTNYAPVGMPIPVAYGEQRTGGSVIAAFIDVDNGIEPEATLYLLLLLGAGPIDSIGGVTTDADGLTGDDLPEGLLVNGNSAKHLPEVSVSVRLGALIQDVIPGFESVKTFYAVGLPIDQTAGSSSDPAVTDWSLAATWDMPEGETADGYSILLNFPEGLYDSNSNGVLKSASIQVQVRLQEMPASGSTPIGSPIVPSGDGSIKITAKSSASMQYQINGSFFDTALFQPPAQSPAVRCEIANRQWLSVDLPLAHMPEWAAGNVIESFTFVEVLQVRQVVEHAPIWGWNDFNDDLLDPHVKGIMVDLEEVSGTEYQLLVMWGDGTGGSDNVGVVRVGSIVEDVPFLVAVSWKRNAAPGGQHRLRIYLDGGLIHEEFTTAGIESPSAAQMGWSRMEDFNNDEAIPGPWYGPIDHDEIRLYDAELTPADIADLHNNGTWLSGSATDASLVLGFHMDQVLPIDTTPVIPSYAPSYDAVRMFTHAVGGAYSELTDGFVLDQSTNIIKRGRYRIEVQRLTKEHGGYAYKDVVELEAVTTILDDDLAYPGCALLGVKIVGSEVLNSNQPDVSVPFKGRNDIPVWDGNSVDHPTFTKGYSANPFWVLAHHLLDKESGAGHVYDSSRIGWQSFKDAADYCDVLVYDQRGKLGGTAAPLKLDYMASGVGLAGEVYQLKIPTPILDHIQVGRTVRLQGLTSPYPTGDYPEGDFVVRNVVATTGTEWEVWLDWPDGLSAPSVQPTTDTAAQLFALEPRMETHITLGDRGLPFLEARQLLASIGRGACTSVGDKVEIAQQRPRQPVHAFTPANIAADSFRMSSVRPIGGRFNSATAEFQDRDKLHARNTISRDHPSLSDATSSAEVRRTVIDMRGVNNGSQVHRELALQLNVFSLITIQVEFESSADGVFIMPGDVFVLTHPLPSWSAGGRLAQASAAADEVYPDTPVVLGTVNMLERVNQLDHAKWTKDATSGSAPSIDETAVAGPGDDGLVADEVTFPVASTNPFFEQGVPNRGVGFQVSGIIELKLQSGEADQLVIELYSSAETLATATPTLTGSWVRYVVSGVSTASAATAPTVFFRVRLAGTAAGDVTVRVARQRVISGADDGEDAVGDEAVVDHVAHYAAVVNPGASGVLSYVATLGSAGRWEAGEHLALADDLSWVPGDGWFWVVGPMTYGSRLFECSFSAPTPDLRCRIQAVEYNEAIFPDEDDFDILPQAIVAGAGESALELLGGSVLPGPVASMGVTEETFRDPTSGTLGLALGVSWRLEPATAQHVARTRVWLREGTDGAWEPMGEVDGRATAYRIASASLDPAVTYHVAVQPVTKAGAVVPLRRCRTAALQPSGVFPVPDAPTAARVFLAGDRATYEVDLPAGMQGATVEVYRGGTFCGQEVGRIPPGGTVLGPTDDWCKLPTSVQGRGDPPLYMRLSLPNGTRGPFLRVNTALGARGFPAAIAEESLEDGPWDQAGAVLTELVRATSPIVGEADWLIFDSGSSELTGTFESPVYDLGRSRRVHVSAGIEALQAPPVSTVDTSRVLASPHLRSWTPQGHMDPGAANYGRVGCFLEWAWSDTSGTPGSDYEPFRCGVALVRSCRFRVRFVRPDATWDVRLERMGIAIRPLPELAVSDYEVTS